MSRALRRGLGSIVKLAARASARSSSRSMLSSSSRNGLSVGAALECHNMSPPRNALVRAEDQLPAGLRKASHHLMDGRVFNCEQPPWIVGRILENMLKTIL